MESILVTIKKMLGMEANYTHFDTDVIVNINTAIMTLTQLGVGPPNGYYIAGSEDAWLDFIADATDLEGIKSYIYLKVRLLFDPPTSAFVLTAMENQIKELEWRIRVNSEESKDIEEGEYGGK